MPCMENQLTLWRETDYAEAVRKHPERKPTFRTSSGIELAPCYGPEPEGASFPEHVGVPGRAPFTRGVQTTMYRGRLWTMRQYAGFATAEESNRRYRALLRTAVMETVSNPEDLEQELRWLFGEKTS